MLAFCDSLCCFKKLLGFSPSLVATHSTSTAQRIWRGLADSQQPGDRDLGQRQPGRQSHPHWVSGEEPRRLWVAALASDTCCVLPPQFPGQFHGGRSGRLHAWQQAQRPARHHPSPDLCRTHPHHLPPGEASEADLPPTSGGGGGAGQQDHFSGPSRDAVFGVRKRLKRMKNISGICFIITNILDSSQTLKLASENHGVATFSQLNLCSTFHTTSNTK